MAIRTADKARPLVIFEITHQNNETVAIFPGLLQALAYKGKPAALAREARIDDKGPEKQGAFFAANRQLGEFD